MRQSAMDILMQLYNVYQAGTNLLDIPFKDEQGNPIPNYRQITDDLEILKDSGYISVLAFMGIMQCKITAAGILYIENLNNAPSATNPSIHIENITGTAIVGSQHGFTVNINPSLDELKNIISTKPPEEQEALTKLLEHIETTLGENKPISKGSLSRFRDIIIKYSDIAVAISNLILAYATVFHP